MSAITGTRIDQVLQDAVESGAVPNVVAMAANEKGPIYQRAHDFDENTAEYIIAGAPGDQEAINVEKPAGAPRKGRPAKTRIPAAATNAVAVARTAGG